MLNINLKDRVALVIGGSRGIGASITRCLCKGGATTVFTHTANHKHSDRLKALLRELEGAPGLAIAVATDALDSLASERLVNDVAKEHGKVDILVTNVGQNTERRAEDLTDEQWRTGLNINLSSAFFSLSSL